MNDKKINESLQKNSPTTSQTQTTSQTLKTKTSNIKEFGNDEKLYTIKLEEDCEDAKHSLDNAKNLIKFTHNSY